MFILFFNEMYKVAFQSLSPDLSDQSVELYKNCYDPSLQQAALHDSSSTIESRSRARAIRPRTFSAAFFAEVDRPLAA